ncbi:MAG: UDP-N-acetylglucosamine 2-epimerase (non-hydrolyzing) [Bacteroidetes bacterium]|nr:UDP-N-acetylglucosamine 2-epimerase (non-hydrolyzing) [Bacteroidota bacterium]
MKNILIVFGTRPEAIKMAPVIKEIQKFPDIFNLTVCVTAQHRQMLDQVLYLFEIKPDIDLDLMKANQDLFDITINVLKGLKEVILRVQPDLVLIHGDTTTAMTTALAAFYHRIPIGHIEAGLRTYDKYSPWPEEINRQITDRIATYLFPPTIKSKENLLTEGCIEENMIVTGNTVIDALHYVVEKIQNSANIRTKLSEVIIASGYNAFENLRSKNRKLILVTGHRRENFGEGFINICMALKEIALRNDSVDIVYPVHLNPNVRKPVNEILSGLPNIFLIEPLDYEPFVYLMNESHFLISDSGGIQEEAPSLGKPVLVMRETTERPEAVSAGTVKLVGTDKYLIISEAETLLRDESAYMKMSKANNPFGDGNASKQIVNFLKQKLYEKYAN